MPDMTKDISMLTAQLEKLQRRQQRNQRAAHAEGLLQGIYSLLKTGDIVVDCGANVGDVSVPLARTGATVHAFEPDPYAFEQLTEAVREFPNVTLHNAAVGIEAGSIRLMRAENFAENPRGASLKSTVIRGGRKIDETGREATEGALVSLPHIITGLYAEHG